MVWLKVRSHGAASSDLQPQALGQMDGSGRVPPAWGSRRVTLGPAGVTPPPPLLRHSVLPEGGIPPRVFLGVRMRWRRWSSHMTLPFPASFCSHSFQTSSAKALKKKKKTIIKLKINVLTTRILFEDVSELIRIKSYLK